MGAKIREITVCGEVALIHLTRGYVAIIDAADIGLIDQWNWTARVAKTRSGQVRTVYAVRTEKRHKKSRTVYMHRVIAQTPDGFDTDHIDGNGANNVRSNLRTAKRSENMWNRGRTANNTSGVKGVSWHKRDKRWQAKISVDKKETHLGWFKNIDDAAAAYEQASKGLHGEFSRAK